MKHKFCLGLVCFSAVVLSACSQNQTRTRVKNLVVDVEKEAEEFVYVSAGGEDPQHLARQLYGKQSHLLFQMNPKISKTTKLMSGQRVVLDYGHLKPQPPLLTTELIQSKKNELAARLSHYYSESSEHKLRTVALQRGQTLQEVSKKLFGTTRRWTELYLLNHAKIDNFDDVKVGTELQYYVKSEARKVANVRKPSAKRVERLKHRYTVHAGSYRVVSNADRVFERLKSEGLPVLRQVIAKKDLSLHSIKLKPTEDFGEAQAWAKKIHDLFETKIYIYAH